MKKASKVSKASKKVLKKVSKSTKKATVTTEEVKQMANVNLLDVVKPFLAGATGSELTALVAMSMAEIAKKLPADGGVVVTEAKPAGKKRGRKPGSKNGAKKEEKEAKEEAKEEVEAAPAPSGPSEEAAKLIGKSVKFNVGRARREGREGRDR